MGKAAKVRALETDGFVGEYAGVDGSTIGFERYGADSDPADLLRGPPDDRCQCPHWRALGRADLQGGERFDDLDRSG